MDIKDLVPRSVGAKWSQSCLATPDRVPDYG